ncbi:MAG: adenylosuccinate lyase, partial [Bacteroidales bacterium]|nr:adenylosuccinate lyase [Bacteroidales bacterium]
TDSTVCRNVGVPLAHMVVSYKSIQKGLNKLVLNRAALEADLQNNWAVVAEAIQTVLRTQGYPNPYEALKQLTRTGEKITQDHIRQFIDGLDIPAALKARLKQIAPDNYTGYYGLKNR